LAAVQPEELDEQIFSITRHVNAGQPLVVDPRERSTYASLGLRAGRRAIATSAYRSARDYLASALDFLPPAAWTDDFRLAFDLRLELVRCEHLGGDIATASLLTEELLEHAKDPADISAAYALRVELLLAHSEPARAAEAGVEGWRRLGLPIDDEPLPADSDRSLQRILTLLGDRPIEELLTLPPATDPAFLASITLFGPLLTSAFLAERHDLAIYLATECARLSLVHGNSPAAPLLHALFGSLLPARFERYDEGRRLGHAAHELIQRLGILPLAAQTAVYVGNTSSWTDPFRACLPYFRTGFECGVRAGDLAHAGFCGLFSVVWRFAAGDPLEDIEREAEPLFVFADDMKLPENRDALLIVDRTVQSLRGRTNALGSFAGDEFDETDYLDRIATQRPPFYQAILAIHQTTLQVLSRRPAQALAACDQYERVSGGLAWHPLTGQADVWNGLACAGAFDDAPATERKTLRDRVATYQTQVVRWATHGPANYAAAAELLTAELARIDADTDAASAAYERAISAAQDHGALHHEALARELAGRFYASRGLTSVGHACLREAYDRYERWGAAAKTAQLDEEFPGVLGSRDGKPRTPEVDMLAVVRGSQAISGELDLEQLPTTLLRIAVAAAGAQAGHLLRVTGGVAEVAAVAQVQHETVHVTLPDLGETAQVPRSVVDYVLRTGERVLLRDARSDVLFGQDEVIIAGGVRSLLAQPIVRHGSVVGLLVLEHRLVTDAFTPQRLTAVEMLAAQAAISVETAQLYQEVREENRVRRRTEDELRASGEQFRSLVESAPDAILISDAGGRVVLVNSRAEQLFGLDREQLITRTGEQLVPEIDWMGRGPSGDAGAGIEVERRGISSDGTTFPVEVTLSPLDRPDGPWTIAVVRDVTERKRLEHELEQAADHDALTGLLNRAALERELEAAIENVERSRSVAVLLVLDLDRIRDINDSLGPGAGDELISGVAAAIAERIRPTDTLARLDGDEFALILSRTDAAGAEVLADELRTLVREFALERDGAFVRTTASVGIAPIAVGTDTAQSLLAAADIALNEAKEAGRDRVRTYSHDSHRRAAERHTWSERIRHALEHDQFTLHAQPILDLRTGRTTHAELLIRMEDDGTLIPPGDFLPTAERTGSILAIDRWVIREATRLAAAQGDGLLELNLSARSLADLELPDYIEAELERTGADPASLIFEITETAAIANLASAAALAERLTSLGCRFALDDFGVGFGSFYYLKRLPLHYIKIDGDFIQSLTRSQTDQHVTKAIVDVAQGMGLKTIAEFVEDAETLDLLRTYGVDYAQGFHIGRPAQIEESNSGAS
ncbi:MAG: EAL domain-containing protein, partial [Solirubrobacteraceae bacterium]|nr:EAL domain-containing protein [Solirubrobacteraceae bacterium]